MNIRFTIILGYLAFFLWIWLGVELKEMEGKESILRYVPMWGFALTAWIIVRLEFMNKRMKSTDEKATHPSAPTQSNEA